MAWRYVARNGEGQRVGGLIDLPQRKAVLAELLLRGLTPISVKRARQRTKSISYERASRLASELARLAGSGLPMETALSMAAGAEPHIPTRATLERAAQRLSEGAGPGEAFAELEGPAGKVLAAAMKAGERSGDLASALNSVAPVLAATAQFRSKFTTMMLYPAAILVTSTGVLSAFFLYVLPTLRPVFERMGEMRGSAAILFFVADALPLVLTILLVLLLLGLVLSRFPDIRQFFTRQADRLALSPIGLGLARSNNMALFARLYGALLASGAPATEAISEAAGGLSNDILKNRLRQAADQVREGVPQSEALAEVLGHDDLIVRAAMIGDQASLSAPLILEAGNVMVDRAGQRLERAAALASPLIIIVLGAVIAAIVITVFSTLTSLPSSIGS